MVMEDVFSCVLKIPNIGNTLQLLIYPDKRLNKVSENVTTFDQQLLDLICDMYKTMISKNGLGIAAPQINVHKRIIILQIEQNKPIVFINPEIIDIDQTSNFEYSEGCLSVPSFFETRNRPNKITVKFQKENGKQITSQFTELYSFAIQHEIDHLNGKTFVDNVSSLKKDLIKSKIKKTLRHK